MFMYTGEKPFVCEICDVKVACPECGKMIKKRNEFEQLHENPRRRKTIRL